MRRFLGAVALAALVGMSGIAHAETQPVRVTVNGTAIAFPDAQPVVESGRVMVPLRVVAERLGAGQVSWDPETQTVTIVQEGRTTRLKVGRPWATTGRTAIPLDAPPILREGRVLVPLRFVSETLGANVTWRPAERAVVIVTPEGVVAGTRETPVIETPDESTLPPEARTGAVVVRGISLLEISFPGQEQTAFDRARVLGARIARALDTARSLGAWSPDRIQVRTLAGSPVIFIGEIPVLTVTAGDATVAQTTPERLAAQWADQLRQRLPQVPAAPAPAR